MPGIGKGIAGIICDILERGTFDKRDQLLSKYPPTALELLKIQGLGPKSIGLLIEHFRVSTVDDLERICKEQKLRTLPRMGAKLEEKVLRSIQSYRSSSGRFLLPFAKCTADELIEYLSATPGVEKVTAAGSLRRGRETVGDLDLLVTGPDPTPRSGALCPVCAGTRGAWPRREQSEREGRSGRHSSGCARAACGEFRRGDAVLHREQGSQCPASAKGVENGANAQ